MKKILLIGLIFVLVSVSVHAIDIHAGADGGREVFTIDLDQDGDIDVISASYTDDKIAWYENDGSESFTPHNITLGADGASGVFAIDLDQDGDIDVISGSQGDSKVAWYENDGSQSFTAHNITNSILGPYSVYAIDLDGDGDIDVLSGNENANTVVWYENDGSQSWTSHNISWQDSMLGIDVFAIDVDQDGDVDVLSSWYNGNTINWFENDGSESFTTHNITTNAVAAVGVYGIDVDGDGDIDVLSASEQDGRIVWFENDGSESFSPHNISTSASGAFDVFAIDMDNDGDVDVLSASEGGTDEITWFENDGSQSWTSHTISLNVNNPRFIYASDLDQDGDVDVLGSDRTGDRIFWYRNEEIDAATDLKSVDITNITATEHRWDAKWSGGNKLTKFLISNDTNFNLCNYTETSGCMNATAIINSSTSNGEASLYYEISENITWYARVVDQDDDWDDNKSDFGANTYTIGIVDGGRDIISADFDNDGDTDVAAATDNCDRVIVYLNNGSSPPGWTEYNLSNDGTEFNAVYATDVDGDGNVDVLSASVLGETFHWFQNNGSSPPGWTEYIISYESDYAAGAINTWDIIAEDMDNDGDVDIIGSNYWFNDLLYFENNGSLFNWTRYVIQAPVSNGGYRRINIADVDNDGDRDIIVPDLTSDDVRWYDNNGSSPPGWTQYIALEGIESPEEAYPIDINLDGNIDLAVQAGGVQDYVQWMEHNGSSPPGWTNTTVDSFNSVRAILAEDLDYDGDIDIIAGGDAGTVSWFINNGSQNWSAETIATETSIWSFFIDDMDNDGDWDVMTALDGGDAIKWHETTGTDRLTGSLTYIAPNNAPTISTPTLTPATAYTTNDLNCTFVIEDVDDGDTLNGNVSWFKDDVLNLSYQVSVTNGTSFSTYLFSGNTTKDEVWNCTVYPYDGTAFGTSDSVTKTITNTLSTLTVNISSDDPGNNTNGNLTCGWAFSDVDSGDTEVDKEIKWYNTSYELTSLINITKIYSGNLSANEDYKCSVRVNDGDDWSTWYNTSSLTVLPLNTAPVLNSVNISSDDLNWTSGNITIGYDATDADSDPLTAEVYWFQDGIQNTTFTNITLLGASNLTEGEKWWASVKVDDGQAASSWLNTSNLTILIDYPVVWFNTTNLTEIEDDSWYVFYYYANDTSSLNNCTMYYDDPATHTHTALNTSLDRGLISAYMYFESVDEFVVTLNCSDVFGYDNSTRLTVNCVQAGGGGGGGGGGGTSSPSLDADQTTVPNVESSYVSRESILAGLTVQDEFVFQQIPPSTKIDFYVNNDQHHLIVNNIRGEEVDMELRSEPITFTLTKNETGYYDITQDSIVDVSVTLEEIREEDVDLSITIYNLPSKKPLINIGKFIRENKSSVLVVLVLFVLYQFHFKEKIKWRRKKSQRRERRI